MSTAAAADAATAAHIQPARARVALSWGVRTILALAAVLSVAAIFAVWANRQLLDTGYWTRTNTKLLENRAIQGQLSSYLTEQLYENVDVAGELRSDLPGGLKPLAGAAAGGLRTVVEKAIVLALQTSQVQQLWRVSNETTHRELVRLIEDRSKVVRTPGGGKVVLDLRPIVANLAERFGAPESAVEKVNERVGGITIVRSKSFETLQEAIRGLHDLALVLPALALLLLALAIGLARGRRSRAILAVGVIGVGVGLATLILRSLIGSEVVDRLASTEAVRPAASAAWSISTSLLADLAVAAIFISVFVILAAWLAGGSGWAMATRRALAPYLRDRPALAFSSAAILLLLVLLWGPIAATQKATGIVTIIVLSIFGLEMLRRQTAAEFPDVHYVLERDGFRVRAAGVGGWLARRATSLRSGAASAVEYGKDHSVRAQPGPQPVVPSAPAVEQLERLAALHASGALTDQEFAAAKQQLLGA